jgi:hypothetical protein
MGRGVVACFLTATSVLAESTAARTAKGAPALVSKAGASPNLLRAFDSSLETVISKVPPAVVEGGRTALAAASTAFRPVL